MIRRRCVVLLIFVLLLASVTLYLRLDVNRTADVDSLLYNQPRLTEFVTSQDILIGRSLQVAKPLPASALENCSGGTTVYDQYCVMSPYGYEVRNTTKSGTVTLCTQGTVEFLHHVVVLCHRWSNPVSVAVYSPPEDYADAKMMVELLRRCDSCVRYWVNWHFFFNANMKLPPVDQSHAVLDCSSVTQMKKPDNRRSQGIYPINVGRNIARRLSATPFVFSIDIELYPSLDIPAKFERMLRSGAVPNPENRVWVLPVFEVNSKVRAPLLKSQLRGLYAKKQAISFHQYRCNKCHRIPNLTQWMSHGVGTASTEVEESLEPLRVWTTVKRSRRNKLQEWEPFFIGTTKDPEFDVRLSWEGKSNKMQMAYEMCMRDYDFHIIENAFLVHSPGINVYNATTATEKKRRKYLAQNRKVISMVKKNLVQKYGSDKDC